MAGIQPLTDGEFEALVEHTLRTGLRRQRKIQIIVDIVSDPN